MDKGEEGCPGPTWGTSRQKTDVLRDIANSHNSRNNQHSCECEVTRVFHSASNSIHSLTATLTESAVVKNGDMKQRVSWFNLVTVILLQDQPWLNGSDSRHGYLSADNYSSE